MYKKILVLMFVMMFACHAYAESKQSNKNDTTKSENPLDKLSKEDILDRINGVLSRNPQILADIPAITKEKKGGLESFSIDGKPMESLSKEDLWGILTRGINPILQKIQQERLKKQNDQIRKMHEQNMAIQRMVQQQQQMKPPTVYTPPTANKAPTAYTPPTVFRPPAPQPAAPRR